MSGGSYSYLCYKSADELFSHGAQVDLGRMAEALTAMGDADDAAAETEELIAIMRSTERRMNVRIKRLEEVWRAVEWWHSCDSGEDGVRAALAKYREDTANERP